MWPVLAVHAPDEKLTPPEALLAITTDVYFAGCRAAYHLNIGEPAVYFVGDGFQVVLAGTDKTTRAMSGWAAPA